MRLSQDRLDLYHSHGFQATMERQRQFPQRGYAIVSEYVTVAKVGEIAEGEGQAFQVGNRLVALFFQHGQYTAIDDLCPHMGASLAAGPLAEDGTVVCPWHAWRFRTCDGTWCDNPSIQIDTYDVRVRGDEIQVRAKG